MTEFNPIRQLPELDENQEWCCEGGCSNVEPKLHRNIYSEGECLKTGKKLYQQSEHYYTCQRGHILAVWDEDQGDYVQLPKEHYQERENRFNLTMDNVNAILAELESEKKRLLEGLVSVEFLSLAKISFELKFKSGKTLSVDEHYLNEIKGVIIDNIEEDKYLNHLADIHKDQPKIRVNIEDL